MRLALEIPKSSLDELSKLTDVDFALAHMVLNDKEYADFYAEQRRRQRRVVLDNGMHELGKPLTVNELIEAAKRINPSCVCPPDKLGDAAFTAAGFNELRKHPSCTWDPMLVIQGETPSDRISLFTMGRSYTNTLALPFREPRTTWLKELVAATPKQIAWPRHLHLFGVNELQELVWFSRFCEGLHWDSAAITVDTGKPIKWAVSKKRIDELDKLRGGGQLDHTVKLTVEQRLLAFYNIGYLRRYMC